MKINHVMIDIETMALTERAAIVSIGAVIFDPRANKVTAETFYRELNWRKQGRTIDPNTRQWWTQQTKAARASLRGKGGLVDALEDLAWWLPDDCKVWGNGPTFDIIILENAYRQEGVAVPWKFWNIRDCRTIKDIYESARGGFSDASGGVEHNALDDARYQAEYVCKMWKSILGA